MQSKSVLYCILIFLRMRDFILFLSFNFQPNILYAFTSSKNKTKKTKTVNGEAIIYRMSSTFVSFQIEMAL